MLHLVDKGTEHTLWLQKFSFIWRHCHNFFSRHISIQNDSTVHGENYSLIFTFLAKLGLLYNSGKPVSVLNRGRICEEEMYNMFWLLSWKMKASETQTPSIFCNLKVSKVEIYVFWDKSDLRRVDKDAGSTLEKTTHSQTFKTSCVNKTF